jgi:plastocyanin
MRPPGRLALLAAVLAASLALTETGPAPAGALSGRVEIVHPLRATPATTETGAEEHGPPVVRRQAVVYFAEAPAGTDPPAPMRARMSQQNETFVPHLLAVTTGSTVDFPNDDRTYHNVFSLSKTKRFDLGRYAAGRSKAVTFDKPGIIRVFCDIHSRMNAFILVFAHQFFAVTDEQGRYRIDKVPPGTYQVTAWYEGTAEESRQVTIPPGGAAELDFRIRQ